MFKSSGICLKSAFQIMEAAFLFDSSGGNSRVLSIAGKIVKWLRSFTAQS